MPSRLSTKYLLPALLSSLSVAGEAAYWPQYRADSGRSGYTAEDLPDTLNLQWTYKALHSPRPAWPDPGWEPHRMPFDFAYQVVVADGTLVFGSSADGKVYALDAATGRERWHFSTGAPVRLAPALWRNRAYVTSDDGYLYCLDAKSGTPIWKKRGGLDHRKVLGNGRMVSLWCARGGPVVEDGVVYFGAGIFPADGFFLYALDARTGDVVWLDDTARQVGAQGHLALNDTTVFVSNGRNMPAAFDRESGALKYRMIGCPFRAGGTNTVVMDTILFNAEVAYNADTFKVICPNMGNRRRRQRDRELVVSPTHVFIADGQEIKAAGRRALFGGAFDGSRKNVYNDNNRLRSYQWGEKKAVQYSWPEPVKVDCRGALIGAGRRLYAGGENSVSAVDTSTRRLVWTAQVEGTVYGLAAADGRLYASTDKGLIYCFGSGRGTGAVIERKTSAAPYGNTAAYARAAAEIIRKSGITEGYCLDIDCGDGKLAFELAKRTDLHIYAVDTDPAKVRAARTALDRAGLHGVRVWVEHVDDLSATGCPDYFANLIVSGRSAADGIAGIPMDEVKRIQRPWGGVAVLGKPGAMKRTERGALKGEGTWTHQYADTGNTSCSGDSVVKSPLGVLWFGGPSAKGTPHAWGRAPAPLYMRGRLYVMGVDFIRCQDAYNGRVVWESPVKGIADPYRRGDYGGTYIHGSSWCMSEDGIFARIGTECVRIDNVTGKWTLALL